MSRERKLILFRNSTRDSIRATSFLSSKYLIDGSVVDFISSVKDDI